MLKQPEYRYVYLLLYWIVYLAMFQLIEHLVVSDYKILHCELDNYIPFNEFFVVPYLYWFIFMGSFVVYTLFNDRDCFIYYMKMIIIISISACIIYVVWPNGLNLRPESFTRNNIFTKAVSMIYSFDTPVNVCPSLHVSGTLVTLMASRKCQKFDTVPWKIYFVFCSIAICLSTVFLKQHSVIDVFWGMVQALVADALININKLKITNKKYKAIKKLL